MSLHLLRLRAPGSISTSVATVKSDGGWEGLTPWPLRQIWNAEIFFFWNTLTLNLLCQCHYSRHFCCLQAQWTWHPLKLLVMTSCQWKPVWNPNLTQTLKECRMWDAFTARGQKKKISDFKHPVRRKRSVQQNKMQPKRIKWWKTTELNRNILAHAHTLDFTNDVLELYFSRSLQTLSLDFRFLIFLNP